MSLVTVYRVIDTKPFMDRKPSILSSRKIVDLDAVPVFVKNGKLVPQSDNAFAGAALKALLGRSVSEETAAFVENIFELLIETFGETGVIRQFKNQQKDGSLKFSDVKEYVANQISSHLALFREKKKAENVKALLEIKSLRNAITMLENDTSKWPNGCPIDQTSNPEVNLTSPNSGIISAPSIFSSGTCSWNAGIVFLDFENSESL
jgi:hypothetical protein